MAVTPVPALADVRVLEIGGGVTVSYATRLLADLGAEVVKIEAPGGEPLRQSDGCHGAFFAYLNAGKRSVALDLAAEEDQRALGALATTVQVIVEGLGPGVFESLGSPSTPLVPDDQATALVHVSPWGRTGPYRDRPATSLVLQAAAGWVSTRGVVGRPPVRVGGHMDRLSAGAYAATATLTALAAAEQREELVSVDFSVFESLHSTLPYQRLLLETFRDLGRSTAMTPRTPLGIRACRDGWVGINVLTGQHWIDACHLLEVPDYAERQHDLMWGDLDISDFWDRTQTWLDERPVEEVVAVCQALRIPACPVGNGAAVKEYAHWRERPFYVQVDAPPQRHRRPGPPWRLSRTPARGDASAPNIREHNARERHRAQRPETQDG